MKHTLRNATFVGTVLIAGVALADTIGEADAVTKYRQDAMASVGGHIGAMVANLKGDIDDPAGLVAHANALAAATDPAILKGAFQQNTHGQSTVETTATAEIWNDWDGFAKQIDLLNAAAISIAAQANAGNLNAFEQLQPALDTCGACHRELGYRSR